MLGLLALAAGALAGAGLKNARRAVSVRQKAAPGPGAASPFAYPYGLTDGDLCRADSGDTDAVWVFDSGKRRHIRNMAIVAQLGGETAVRVLPASALEAVPQGDDLGQPPGLLEGLVDDLGHDLDSLSSFAKANPALSLIVGPGQYLSAAYPSQSAALAGSIVGGPGAGKVAGAAVGGVQAAGQTPKAGQPAGSRSLTGLMVRADSGDTEAIWYVSPAGQRQHIRSMDTVNARGGTQAVRTIPAQALSALPLGPDLP